MEMGKEIPPEVGSDIRVHLCSYVDLSLGHMFSESTELPEKVKESVSWFFDRLYRDVGCLCWCPFGLGPSCLTHRGQS